MRRVKRALYASLFCMVAFVFAVSWAHGEEKEIRILHVNDFHGYASEYKTFGSHEVKGGVAYLAWRAEALRKEKPSLLLSAGDMIQGNNFTNLFYGKPVIEIMNEMRFDAMVVGNHEFDFGQTTLRRRIREARFPVLGANVVGLPSLKPFVIKELEGVKIGIIGVVTEDTPVTTHPRNVEGLKFLSSAETAEKYVKELRGKVDIILLLSHIGLNWDVLLAERVKGIDVIVGGHTHTRLERYMTIGNTIIVQAWEHGLVLGVLDLLVKDGKIKSAKSRLEEIRPREMKKYGPVAEIVDDYKARADELMGEIVGETEVDLDGKYVRLRETNLGDFAADVIREKTGADCAVMNGGGIRASIAKGHVKTGDVYSALPFDNYIVAVKLTGRQLMEVLEHGVSEVENEEGRFLQVSGMAFIYSRTQPKGARIKEVLIDGKPLQKDRIYTVATIDFLAAGGDGFKTFGEAVRSSKDYSMVGGAMKGENLVYSDAGRWLRDLAIDYIKARKKISPKVEGRIKEL